MRKESKKFLRDYLNANSPTGFETAGQKIWLEYMKQYIDEYEVDVYGSVVGVINPGQKYKVVIEAISMLSETAEVIIKLHQVCVFTCIRLKVR
jgi:TPP-dependent indolepyruvate ferredoxin oxidoreductase alpha subunit